MAKQIIGPGILLVLGVLLGSDDPVESQEVV